MNERGGQQWPGRPGLAREKKQQRRRVGVLFGANEQGRQHRRRRLPRSFYGWTFPSSPRWRRGRFAMVPRSRSRARAGSRDVQLTAQQDPRNDPILDGTATMNAAIKTKKNINH
jgi:hypothetical protein